MTDTPIVFHALVKLAADDTGRLRVCDVFRVVDAAFNNLDRPDYDRFVRWLRDRVPTAEHRAELADVVAELDETSAIADA